MDDMEAFLFLFIKPTKKKEIMKINYFSALVFFFFLYIWMFSALITDCSF